MWSVSSVTTSLTLFPRFFQVAVDAMVSRIMPAFRQKLMGSRNGKSVSMTFTSMIPETP